jgi:crotonobetainyl-CoA:carnitine CoA-transferase CaiB-like acyl-CoA transferase
MLAGVKILEIEGLGPGPFAGMTLADLGAEVTVVHRKSGRQAPGLADRPMVIDRGKRSIALDLKEQPDLDIVRALIARSDALIEGFRPGVMERLGLGPDQAQALRPSLVYGRITGWGQTGPRALQAGHDLNYLALSGAAHYASPPGQPPAPPPTMLGDVAGGALYLVIGILSGLINARVTGKGCVVDAAIVDGAAHMMNLLMSLGPGLSMTRGASLLDGPHWSRCYRCADGQYISVQCLEPQFYAEFLDVLGLAHDPQFQRQMDSAAWPVLGDRLTRLFDRYPRSHWVEVFDGTDACVAPVHDPVAASRDPHMAARGSWTSVDGAMQAAPAPRFDANVRTPGAIPARDQHRAQILATLLH